MLLFRKHLFHPPDPHDQLISRPIPCTHHYAIRQIYHKHTVQPIRSRTTQHVTRLFPVFIDYGIPFHFMWPPQSMISASVQFIIALYLLCYLLQAPEYHVAEWPQIYITLTHNLQTLAAAHSHC